uniref:hypothetical protein n=1 Tax=Pantoea sp. A4 TaxID=1225184 RepID=UPI001ED9C0ED
SFSRHHLNLVIETDNQKGYLIGEKSPQVQAEHWHSRSQLNQTAGSNSKSAPFIIHKLQKEQVAEFQDAGIV